ncbi:MAG: hypothetical protein LBG88_02295 [Christensenellaceae bacterium]|jgi:hypothetical protein|nr:hypothetical protein [Christensenellaceae bacterium]
MEKQSKENVSFLCNTSPSRLWYILGGLGGAIVAKRIKFYRFTLENNDLCQTQVKNDAPVGNEVKHDKTTVKEVVLKEGPRYGKVIITFTNFKKESYLVNPKYYGDVHKIAQRIKE